MDHKVSIFYYVFSFIIKEVLNRFKFFKNFDDNFNNNFKVRGQKNKHKDLSINFFILYQFKKM